MSGAPDLTPAQQDYLAALTAAGIHPASDLRALSIGAYVCQARAAGQSDQAVWDSVAPMVRSEVTESPAQSIPAAVPQSAAPAAPSIAVPTATAMDDNSVVGDFIRIATGKLC
jgi:hypothetical protein